LVRPDDIRNQAEGINLLAVSEGDVQLDRYSLGLPLDVESNRLDCTVNVASTTAAIVIVRSGYTGGGIARWCTTLWIVLAATGTTMGGFGGTAFFRVSVAVVVAVRQFLLRSLCFARQIVGSFSNVRIMAIPPTGTYITDVVAVAKVAG
jgi:hypothetical protein